MDFQKKGWLKRYLHIRNNYALMKEYDRLINMEKESISPENLLYQLLQPSGLLYGHPASIPISYKSLLRALRAENLTDKEKTKVILTESFLNSGLVSPRYNQINQKVDVADALLESALNIGKYYSALYPIKQEKKGLFRKTKKGLELSEDLINQRIVSETGHQKIWTGFFRSSMYFLDVLHFGPWLHAHNNNDNGNEIILAHQQDRLLIFKVIVAAAYANQVIEPEERSMLENYLRLAHFDDKTNKTALKVFEKGATIKNIRLGRIRSLTMKKHLMELAILTVCADREVNKEEEIFLEGLRKALKLDLGTYLASEIAVESFMLENWQKMTRQVDSSMTDHLGTQLLSRIYDLIVIEEKAFKLEVAGKPDLQKLLLKMQNEKLTTENRNKIRQELIQAINLLPSLRDIALPKTFLTFPRLMQIFPEDYFAVGISQPSK